MKLMKDMIFDVLDAFEGSPGDLFASFPQIFDRHAEWLDLILGGIAPAAFLALDMTLHTAVGLWVTALTLKRRAFTAGAPAGMCHFSISLMGNCEMLEEAYMFSNLIALPMLARRTGPKHPMDSGVYGMAGLCLMWGPSYSSSFKLFDTCFDVALKMGDFAWCGYGRTFHLWLCMASNVRYKRVMALFEEFSPLIEKAGLHDMCQSMLGVKYACLLLCGQFRESDRSKMLELERSGSRSSFVDASVFCWMMFAYHLIGRNSDAHRCWCRFDEATYKGSAGMSPHYEYHWISPLTCSAHLISKKSVDQCRDSAEWASMQQCRDKLVIWEKVSPRNWSAKRLLVDALIMWVEWVHPGIKEKEEAPNLHSVLKAFEIAISTGRESKFPQIVAIAASKAAIVCQVNHTGNHTGLCANEWFHAATLFSP